MVGYAEWAPQYTIQIVTKAMHLCKTTWADYQSLTQHGSGVNCRVPLLVILYVQMFKTYSGNMLSKFYMWSKWNNKPESTSWVLWILLTEYIETLNSVSSNSFGKCLSSRYLCTYATVKGKATAKTPDLIVVHQTIIDTLHEERKIQKFISGSHRLLCRNIYKKSNEEWFKD